MSNRTSLLIFLALITIGAGIVLFRVLGKDAEPGQTFAATIDRDCAPWDGSAFTVTVPLQDMRISISIYQAPALQARTSFRFPDDTMKVGNALLNLPLGSPETLSGIVSFQGVVQERPVECQFDLMTNDGQRFHGKFVASWGNEVVLCG